MQIDQTRTENMTIYKFTARGVTYDVFARDGGLEDVWSNRISHASAPVLKVYDSIDQLAKRSKMFANFAILIK